VVRDNLKKVRERIAAACESVGRDPGEVKIVVVTKTHPAEVVREAIAAGINIIGENRVQEAEEKYNQVEAHVEWHLVGHLQRNKVRKALSIFSMIESLDSSRLASEIEKESAKRDQITPCLIEVNTSDEETKFGVSPDKLAELVTEVIKFEHIKLVGLMTVGPLTEDKDKIRRSFVQLRELRDRVENIFGCYLPHLSMGMSDDFEIAVQEGATMVRLGRVLLGPRGE
jgi:pyridoxal phosphate enzyme (YggS family)